MLYLKASDFEPNIEDQYARICGVNNESYVKHCQALGGHDLEYKTMYEYDLIVHPVTNEPALCVHDTTYLNRFFINKLVTKSVMDKEQWFEEAV